MRETGSNSTAPFDSPRRVNDVAYFQPDGSFSDAAYWISSALRLPGVEQEGVPTDHGEVRRGAQVLGAGRVGRRKVVERDLDRIGARRHIDLERVHVDGVPAPLQRLPARLDPETREIGNRPGRPVVARHPFRIEKRHGPGPGWNGQMGVKELSRRLASVHLDGHSPFRRPREGRERRRQNG